MSEKRRDNKNRILRNGESQNADGRYVYKYYDILHKPHFLYSWRLESTDKLPAGRRKDLSLREKIREVQKDLFDGIDSQGGTMSAGVGSKIYCNENRGQENNKSRIQDCG